MTNSRDELSIAVVGFAFRLPGAEGEDLWQALLDGKDLVSSVESSRFSQDSLLHPNKGEPGTSYTFAAGSIGDVAGFDAAFFGISPREAEQMDPQQRLLLEMAWEAFEQAGIPPSSMRGRRCGVYVGLSSVDYSYRRADDMGAIDSTTMTGNAGSIAANRISYVFDLRGPSMVIDTACSSSLVAFHQACQAIHGGDADAAIVGGISLHLHPYGFVGFSKASMLSRRGRCGVFDADADGYVRSEGGGIVILKPLAQALADGNRILAVVAGTGVNSDGRKSGLTVPSHTAQASLLRDVYGRAGIAPSDIDYYEAHGTGTAVGDPLETRAIGEALGRRRPAGKPLPIGSIKGNIGHLEAAAGMAGLVKALHVLRDRRVPANIHLNTPNPDIDLSGWNLAPVTESFSLASDRPVTVGVSAFGFGGTNAHVVLTSVEAAAARDSQPTQGAKPAPSSELALDSQPDSGPAQPLLLSARSPAALRAVAGQMARHLRLSEDSALRDIVYTAAAHRDIHPHRLAATGADRAALAVALEQFAENGAADAISVGRYRADATAPAFVYSGNGAQWAGMGLELMNSEPVFLAAVAEVDALYEALCGESIIAELHSRPDLNRFAYTEVAQPALFAVQVALTRLLEHRGVRPMAVCGHSVGEVAAAWACGALTLTQAVRVIHERSAHQARTRGQGCMTAASLGRAEAEALLDSLMLGPSLEIAAINSAHAVTFAGDHEAMSRVEAALQQRRVAYQRLALDYAFHSAAMDPMRLDLLRSLKGLTAAEPRIPMVSSVTGTRVVSTALRPALGAHYWWRNVREPVNFEGAIQALMQSGVNTFVEIGPRAVLANYVTDLTKPLGPAAAVMASLTRHESGAARVAALVTQLELSGVHVGRPALPSGRQVDLPHYPWQRERYWHPTTPESQGYLTRHVVHPLLGYAVSGATLQWENQLDTTKLPGYADHVVGGGAVFPAAGFVEMALAAGRARRGPDGDAHRPHVIEDLEILAPLLLDADHSRTVRLSIEAADGRFTIVSRERVGDEPWRTHVTGRLVEDTVLAAGQPVDAPVRPADVEADAHYAFARCLGLEYGPAFRTVGGVWYRREGLFGKITTPAEISAETSTALLHPAYLDGAFQLLADLALRERQPGPSQAFLPVRIARLELLQPGTRVDSALAAIADAEHRRGRSIRADFTLFDGAGGAIAVARGVRFRSVGMQGARSAPVQWIATRAVPMPRRDRRAAPLPDNAAVARRLAERLHRPARQAGRERFSQEIEPLLDALCASFAARALRELWGAQPIDIDGWVASGRVAAAGVPLLRALVQLLIDDGVLHAVGGQTLWRPDAALPPHQDIWSSLIADYPAYAALTARVGAAGLHLAERLRAGAGGAAAARPERFSPWVDACTQEEAADLVDALADVLRHALETQPAHGRMRVLRLIAQPPAEGLELLPTLDADRCDIVIGALNQAVLDDLRGRFPEISALACHVIDLDGVAPSVEKLGGGFDIVSLTEGLAEAPDPHRRLQNIRGLLLDGGQLTLLEQQRCRAFDLVYGMDPLWWRTDGGPARSRLCAPEAWVELLVRAGFDSIEVVRDTPDVPTGPYLMVARARENAPATADTPVNAGPDAGADAGAVADGRTFLMICEDTGYSAALARALSAALGDRGRRVVRVVVGTAYRRTGQLSFTLDPHTAPHWERLLTDLATLGDEPDAWIHLAGLDPGSRTRPPGARAAAQESRADILVKWLQTCARRRIKPDVWVVGAQTGTALLPAAARAALGGGPRSAAPLKNTARPRNTGPSKDTAPADGLRDAALWGIARVAIHEFADQRIRWLDLIEPLPFLVDAARVAGEMLAPDAEDEVLLTGAGRWVPRFAPAALPGAPADSGAIDGTPSRRSPADSGPVDGGPRRFQLGCPVPGPFRNLTWQAAPDPGPLADDEVEIEVYAAGLNFRDVMYAMGVLPDEAVEDGFCGATLGMEVSGIVTRVGAGVTHVAPADAVIAFAPASFGTQVRTRELAVTRKPDAWSFAAAATVPTAFFTAYYALHELAHLREGERVLIHGGAGGVGIAAIQLAKHWGAEIFVTAGTDEKRDFVRLLGADHVFDSRSFAFADEVRHASGGEGVDVVLNSLAGDAIPRNLRLLRPFGRMLELGKRDFYENSQIGLRPFRNNIAYFGIDADQLLAQRPDIARRVFGELMALFADGTLKPLPHRSFDASDIASAFRHMQASRHIGKVVVTFPRDFAPMASAPAAPPPVVIRPDATYLVSGGLTGFGLRTARWLVEQGARHLALLTRRGGAGTPEAAAALALLTASGVSVLAPACDVSDAAQLHEALVLIEACMPPLAGVVHAAMVIEDGMIKDLTRGQLQRVLAPKICGALNLHEATRLRPLDFFVLYSSATTLFGNPGQASYVAANMALEALANERRTQNLPVTCVGWGPIEDAGYLARNERVLSALVGRMGGKALKSDALLHALETLLPTAAGNLGCIDLDWAKLSRSLPGARAPKFSDLASTASGGERGGRGGESAQEIRRWLSTLPEGELHTELNAIVRAEVAEILRIAPERIEPGVSLLDMGMDSLMAVELATSIESRLDIRLSALALGGGPTVENVVDRIARTLRPAEAVVTETATVSAMTEQVYRVAAQHAGDLTAEEAANFGSNQISADGGHARSLTRAAQA